MLSIFCFVFLAIIQKFSFAQDDVAGYVLDTEAPLELVEANLKIMEFRLLNKWVDITLEYSQTSGSAGSDAQWFGIGFGNSRMKCTYAITFEPKLDSDNETISSVTVTERQLGDHEPGRALDRRLAHIESSIVQNPLAVIRMRLIRQRVLPSNAVINSSDICSENPTGYYQFPYDGEDISIIFAKGVDGALSVSFHEQNKNTGSIPLRVATAEEANVSIPTNTTKTPPTCPKPFSLSNYTYAERFDSPFIGRVCGTCLNDNMNSTFVPVTMIPISTSISGISSLVLNNSEENNFQCLIFGENDSYPDPSVCGCANELSPNVSIVFLVDAAGNQNDSDWEQFTWKILEGFFMDVMLQGNTSAITTNDSINTNQTMNNTILENLDVNVIIYGGNYPLQVQKLDWKFLQNISVNPVPKNERFFSNLCNATIFAADYLMNSNQSTKILVTIPWQDASDELDCLVCKNCSLNGINTFTAKVFDKVDLTVIETTFGGYNNCTYLYQNETELDRHNLQEWPFVLAGISDFICLMSEPLIQDINFTLELIMATNIPPVQLNTYLNNISMLIEEAFEDCSNYSVEAEEDFSVECLSINQTDIVLPLPNVQGPMFTVMIENVVHCASHKVEDLLIALAKGTLFSNLINSTFYIFFQSIDGNAIVYVYSVDNVTIFNLSAFTTTAIEPTGIETTMLPSSTNIFDINTTSITPTKATEGNVFDNARRFIMRLAPWMIALIVIAVVVLLLLLIGLLTLCCQRRRRDCEKENVKDKEQMPMIVTNTVASQYIETTKSSKQLKHQTVARANDDEDDQIYV